MKTKSIFIGCLLLSTTLLSLSTFAQNDTVPEPANKPNGGATKFLLAGKAGALWTANTPVNSTSAPNSFNPISLMLMPLVKINDRLFLDAQIEVTANTGLGGGGTSLTLNELIMYYRLCKYGSLFFGNFSPKYGLFMGVLDDFTNRYGSMPIGMGHGPQTQTGVGIQGGIQTGLSKINYQLYVANGPQLVNDSNGKNPGAGSLIYSNYTDNNKNKCIGGSLGWLPFSNSSLQLDLSAQYTPSTGDKVTAWENVNTFSWAASLNYYKVFNPIMLRVMAEYNATQVSNYNYFYDLHAQLPTATNLSYQNQWNGWYAGATVRASGSSSDLWRNLELGVRLSQFTAPLGAPWVGTASGQTLKQQNQTTVCLTYWFTWKHPLNVVWDQFSGGNVPLTNMYTVRSIFFF